jgi:8-oxo-dGTP diphosphatase
MQQSQNMMFPNKYRALLWAVVAALVVMLVVSIAMLRDTLLPVPPRPCPYVWHGGSPTDSHRGSCWCGLDEYCMCTPSLAIDCIIEYEQSVVLVWRKDPPADRFAIPGGFVSVGESAETATIREIKEETNLTLSSLEQFRFYSDPGRDARRHTVSMVYRGTVTDVTSIHTGDDAKSVKVIPMKEVLFLNLAFDHRSIFEDYFRRYHPAILHT